MLRGIKIGLHCLENIIDSICSAVAILNDDRIILGSNDEFENLYGEKEGMRVGNAIKCASLKPGQKCGETHDCNKCELLKAFNELKDSDTRYIRKNIDKEIKGEDGNRILHLRITLSNIMNNEQELVLLVMDDLTEIIDMQDKLYSQNVALTEENNLAAKLQASMIPKKGNIDKKIYYNCVYRPSLALGGDFCDIFKIDKDNVGIYIADVSGHGMKAALLTIFIYSSFNRNLTDPSKTLKKLFNKYREYVTDTSMYITVFYAIINIKERRITYSNAGHGEPGLLIGNDGVITELLAKGLPMSSWKEKAEYTNEFIKYEKGSKLVLYSDGITNSKMKNGKRIDQKKVKELISSNIHSEKLVDDVLEDVQMLQNKNEEQKDDITMISIEL